MLSRTQGVCTEADASACARSDYEERDPDQQANAPEEEAKPKRATKPRAPRPKVTIELLEVRAATETPIRPASRG